MSNIKTRRTEKLWADMEEGRKCLDGLLDTLQRDNLSQAVEAVKTAKKVVIDKVYALLCQEVKELTK